MAKPNVVVIYVDDLGYGDVGAYGAIGVETPAVDGLAADGVRFTNAHASAATCTPSRYSLLTGEYGFRSKARVLRGDAPALIRPGKPTLATLFKSAGYATGVVGKWHLGLGDGDVDWNADVKPGPLEIGFDYSFLLPATGDRVPTVYLENHRIVGLDPVDPITVDYKKKVGDRPTGFENPELLRVPADPGHSFTIINGISRIGYMAGGESALWVDEDFPDVFTGKAIEFIRENRDEPFFLYYAYHDIHVPRLPHPRFQGASTMGPRGDAIAQMDWMTGQIVQELKQLGLYDNTIIIFTSDNGPILNDGYSDQAAELLGDHKPAGPYRGAKYSAFEAGTRVPTIVTWPNGANAGDSPALLSQTDLYASFAQLLGHERVAGEARDSQPLLDALIGKDSVGRDYLFTESVGTVSVRKGSMKYIQPVPEGTRVPKFVTLKNVESGHSTSPQLYDLSVDPGETDNIAEAHPELVRELQNYIGELTDD